MSEFYHHPKDPIEETFDNFKTILSTYGERTPIQDSLNTEPPYPERFTYRLPLDLVQSALPDKDVIPSSAEAYYVSPHRMDEAPYDGLVTAAGIKIDGTLVEANLPISKLYDIRHDPHVGQQLEAKYFFEITDESGQVSLTANYIDPHGRTEEEVFDKALEEHETTTRDITMDEISGFDYILREVAEQEGGAQ